MSALAQAAFGDAVMLWSAGWLTDAEVVDAAVDLLVAGGDTQSLRELAGVPKAEATVRVPDLVEATMRELELHLLEPRTLEAKHAAALVLATQVQRGEVAPRALADWVHEAIGHVDAEELSDLCYLADDYDLLDVNGRTEADVDRKVLAEVARLLDAGG